MTIFAALGHFAGLSSEKPRNIFDFMAISRQRRQLATLDVAALEDMGLSREDVTTEASRPFWDIPQCWRK